MKSILHVITLRNLRNGEYITMGEDTKKITDELAVAAPEIVPFADAFNATMTAISGAFMNDPASPLTHAIEDADARRDAAIVGLTFVVRGYTYSSNPAAKAAADLLLRAISIYSDNISGQSYAAESATLTNLLADFTNKSELSAAIGTLSLSGWITELQAANNDFKAKYQQRTDAYGDQSPDTVRSLRAASDAAFSKLREKAEVYYSLHDGAAPWSTLINRLNAMTDQYNALIASHPPGKPRAKKDMQ